MKANKNTFYITTPIYYASGNLHIGHTYTTVFCDAAARHKRLQGFDVFYLTGTDEHGEKVEENATKAGKSPKAFVDELVVGYKHLWETLNISYDKFIRTTDDYHEKAVQKIFEMLVEKGDIYKGVYEGLYCTPCAAFFTETQAASGKCPDCGRDLKTAREESYFFRLSNYADRLIKYYKDNPDFLQPKMRENEMTAFIKSGLRDLAVSRTSVKWGIPVPQDPSHTIYVWIDALFNYMTALGFQNDEPDLMKYWGADIHVVGKEITRFHMIYWPAFLMALDLPLPKQIYGHGWLMFGGDKMSKSKGNVVDPLILEKHYGKDAIRYYLLKELSNGNDGNYTTEAFLSRINSDLCNDLGNLLSRTTAMVEQYFGGVLPEVATKNETEDAPLLELCKGLYSEVAAAMPLNPDKALVAIFKLIRAANKYIDVTAPWTLNKCGDTGRLASVLNNLTQCLYNVAVLLLPFVPDTAEQILGSLNMPVPTNYKSVEGKCNGVKAGKKITKVPHLFGRLDIAAETKKLENEKKETKMEEVKKEAAAPEAVQNSETKQNPEVAQSDLITIDDFVKVKLKTAKVIACEKVEKADKLLNLTLKLGDEERTVLSGIAEHYTAEEMVGKTVIVVANLAPRKMRGIMSHGMILCAENEAGKVIVVSPESDVPDGVEVR